MLSFLDKIKMKEYPGEIPEFADVQDLIRHFEFINKIHDHNSWVINFWGRISLGLILVVGVIAVFGNVIMYLLTNQQN